MTFNQQNLHMGKNIEEIISQNLFLKYLNGSLESRNTEALKKIELLCQELQRVRTLAQQGHSSNSQQTGRRSPECGKCAEKEKLLADICLKVKQFHGRTPTIDKTSSAYTSHCESSQAMQAESLRGKADHRLSDIESSISRDVDQTDDSFYSLDSTPFAYRIIDEYSEEYRRLEEKYEKLGFEYRRLKAQIQSKQSSIRHTRLMEAGEQPNHSPPKSNKVGSPEGATPKNYPHASASNSCKYPTYHHIQRPHQMREEPGIDDQSPVGTHFGSFHQPQAQPNNTSQPINACLPKNNASDISVSCQSDQVVNSKTHRKEVRRMQIQGIPINQISYHQLKPDPSLRSNTQSSTSKRQAHNVLQATVKNCKRKIFPKSSDLWGKPAMQSKWQHHKPLRSHAIPCKQPDSPLGSASSWSRCSSPESLAKKLFNKIWSPEQICEMGHGIFNNGRLIQTGGAGHLQVTRLNS